MDTPTKKYAKAPDGTVFLWQSWERAGSDMADQRGQKIAAGEVGLFGLAHKCIDAPAPYLGKPGVPLLKSNPTREDAHLTPVVDDNGFPTGEHYEETYTYEGLVKLPKAYEEVSEEEFLASQLNLVEAPAD